MIDILIKAQKKVTNGFVSTHLWFFLGYGGNVVREEVKAKAKWYITDFQQLINAL